MNYQSYLFNPIQSITKSQTMEQQTIQNTVSPINTNNQQLSIQVINLKGKVQSLQAENNRLNGELSDLKIQYSNLQNEQNQYKLEHEAEVKQIQDNNLELTQTKQHLLDTLSKLKNVEKLKVDLLQQLDKVSAENVEISVKLNDLQENFDEKLQQSCQKLIIEAQTQEQEYQQQIQYLQEQLENKNQEYERVNAQLQELQAVQVNYQKLVESAIALQDDNVNIEWQQIINQLTNIIQLCNDQDTEIRRLQIKSNDLETILQLLKVDYDSLKSERNMGMRETQQALAQVQASRANKFGNSIAN